MQKLQDAFAFENDPIENCMMHRPSVHLYDFISFLSDSVPSGNVYLFGGILRDIALMGRRGFHSDVDIVVDGEWDVCASYLESVSAVRNKFGGFRIHVGGWPVDIWNARETWAVRQGLVPYHGIASLTDTTVLNWDAILMNWRTGRIICKSGYLDALAERRLDVVLVENPNPLGMAVRVFRHLCMKDARKVSYNAINYLARTTQMFDLREIQSYEIRSYGDTRIEPDYFRFFEKLSESGANDLRDSYKMLSDSSTGIFNLSLRQEVLYLEL